MNQRVVCKEQDLPEGGRIIVEVGGRVSGGVFKIDGRFAACRNHFPHAGASDMAHYA